MPVDQDFIRRLTARPLTPEIASQNFKCGEEDVELFLKVACRWQDELVAIATCWMLEDVLAGYITTNMASLSLGKSAPADVGVEPVHFTETEGSGFLRTYPALKIGMLGVCEDFHGKGLGSFMVGVAIGQADALSEKTGCRFVIVDSADTARATAMYEKAKFRRVPGQSKRSTVAMFYDVLKNRVAG